jgi:hypothetical protein
MLRVFFQAVANTHVAEYTLSTLGDLIIQFEPLAMRKSVFWKLHTFNFDPEY